MGVSTLALIRVFCVVVLLVLGLDLATMLVYDAKHEPPLMLLGLALGSTTLMMLGIVIKLLIDFGTYLRDDGCCHSKKIYTNVS